MVIVYLSCDVRSIRACSMTCYSWYIVAVPHLYHNLFIDIKSRGRKLRWPNPIRYTHMLGLLPLVKTFWVRSGPNNKRVFSPKQFSCCTLRQFSALTGVRRLMIDFLDIPGFMPKIRRYFGHFLPTVQELCLREPEGSRRQIIYFIGLFKHLEDLYLLYDNDYLPEEPADDLSLTPPFIPPLRGWLKLTSFRRVGLLKDMIDLFGGIRFRWMDLYNVEGMPLLLGACAKTLRTLMLHQNDPRGEQFSPRGVYGSADDSAVNSSLLEFDLSRNKSLRTLQVTASSFGYGPALLLDHVLSTITSPEFFQVMVLYRMCDFHGLRNLRRPGQVPLPQVSQTDNQFDAQSHQRRFSVLRKAHQVRDFRLALCADIWDPVGEYSVQMLKIAVSEEKARNGFDNFFPEPLVTHYPQRSRM